MHSARRIQVPVRAEWARETEARQRGILVGEQIKVGNLVEERTGGSVDNERREYDRRGRDTV